MSPRRYRSELRQAAAAATRRKILDALVDVMAEGATALSMPAVAARAGVSVGTVYHHFGNKAGLLEALLPYIAERTGVETTTIPTDLPGMDVAVRQVFHRLEASDDLLRAALTSGLGRKVRLESTAMRLDLLQEMFRGLDPNLTDQDVERLSKVTMILSTADVYLEWRERLGLTTSQAADEVIWTIRTLLKGLARD